MSRNYDNWEKLVRAVLRREKDRQLALFQSFSSFSSVGDSSRSSFASDIPEFSLSLQNKSDKKCFMVGAKELGIIWCGDTPWYWDYTPHPDSRFSEVALLKSVYWLEIHGTINTQMLSPNTIYGAYLVFKLKEGSYGLESANAFVRFMNDTVGGKDERTTILNHFSKKNARARDRKTKKNARARDRKTGEIPVRIGDGLTEIAPVHLQVNRFYQQEEQTGRFSVERDDGWMEMEMGSFYSGDGDDGAVEAWLLGAEGYSEKSGLIVEGVEFRPKL